MILIYLLLLFFCLLVVTVITIFFVFQIISIFTTDAPFVPIPEGIEGKIIANLKLGERSVLYDLGCGDGRILREAIKVHPNIKAIGVEIAHIPYLLARFYTHKNKNVEIRRANIFTTDVSDATHIFLYLYPHVLEKLLPILKSKVRPGTRIVSCDFEDKNQKPLEIIELNPLAKRGKKLIVYTL